MRILIRLSRCRLSRLPSPAWKLRVTGGVLASLAAGRLGPARAQSFFNPYTAPLPTAASLGAEAAEGGAGDNFQIGRGMPYNPRRGAAPHNYNLKLGPVTGALSSSLAVSYTDNFNLVATANVTKPEGELTVNPSLGIAFQWPVTRSTTLQVDVGVGYVLYLNHPEFNRPSISVSPNSAFEYQFQVGDIRFTAFDRIGTSAQSSQFGQRTDLSGTGSSAAVQFQRISNTIGLSAAWQPTRYTTFSTSYGLDFDHGLGGDNFALSDRLTHTVSGAWHERLDRHWTAGLSASVFSNEYLKGIQNDSTGYGAGPVVTWQPSPFLNFSGSVRYNVGNARPTGMIRDTHGSSGIGYDFSVNHVVNRRFSHGVTFSSGLDLGLGVNFNQSEAIGYRGSWQVSQSISLAFSANYGTTSQGGPGYDFYTPPPGSRTAPNNPFALAVPKGSSFPFPPFPSGTLALPSSNSSGFSYLIPRPAESSEAYNFTLGTSFRLTRNLSASISYAHSIRLSALALRDFHQNTYSLSLGYRF